MQNVKSQRDDERRNEAARAASAGRVQAALRPGDLSNQRDCACLRHSSRPLYRLRYRRRGLARLSAWMDLLYLRSHGGEFIAQVRYPVLLR